MSLSDLPDFIHMVRHDSASALREGLEPLFHRQRDCFQQAAVSNLGNRVGIDNAEQVGIQFDIAGLAEPSPKNVIPLSRGRRFFG